MVEAASGLTRSGDTTQKLASRGSSTGAGQKVANLGSEE